MPFALPARLGKNLLSQPWHKLISAPFSKPRHWHGGVRLQDHKALSNRTPIRHFPLEGCILDIPLVHGRSRAQACVVAGQKVRKGETIAMGPAGTVWIHASTSGTVIGIGECQTADGKERVPSIRIAADGQDEWLRHPLPEQGFTQEQLAGFALRMGLVGLGGAGFPTGLKLAGTSRSPDMLLINGAECEPFISCDDRLMRERAADIIAASDLLASSLGIKQVRIGIEPNKPEAIASLRHAAVQAASNVDICLLPHRYPAGGQALLVKSLSGRTLPSGSLPAEVGVMVLNVATVYALGRAALHGEPLVSRVVTLTGHVEHPGNVEVAIGMPVAALLSHARPRFGHHGVQVGGPMMGQELPDAAAVISKTSSCLIVRSAELFPPRGEESACIRCNRCIDVCPMALQPLQLFAATERGDRAALQQEQLGSCIECGACSHVCPSNLPLRDTFRQAKRTIWLGILQ